MSKFQKIFFSLFIALSLILGFFGYRAIKNSKQPSVKAITLIPDSCELMLSFDNYKEFSNSLRNKNLLWQDLKDLNGLFQLEKHFVYFDSILTANNLLSELASGSPVYLSIYPKNKFVIACNLNELSDQEVFSEIIKKINHSSQFINLIATVEDGVIGISNTEGLLKKLFDQKKSALVNNKNFSFLNNAANYSGTSLYVNKGTDRFLLGNSYSNIQLKPDRIILNGIKNTDSTEFFGEKNAEPQTKIDFLADIPLICNAFEVFVIKNAESAFSTKIKNDWWNGVNENAMFNAKKQFYNTMNGSVIKVSMPSKNTALIVNISDSIKLKEILGFMEDTVLVTIELQDNGVRKLFNRNNSFSASTFPTLNLNEFNYYVLVENRIVFTADARDAEIFVNAKANNSSILGNKKFRQFAAKNFDSEFHYLNYRLVSSLSKTEIPFNELLAEKDLENLKNISHCSFAATYKNNLLNYRLNLSYSQENFSDEPGVLWTMSADTSIITKPFLFKNHITKGNEIVFQTADNKIYLQNATGKTVWKKQISERVRSDIFTVDIFNNKKFQLLFNTDNYIHLIDRNGNYVQGYPVKLPARATNKLCLFDYENKNELRLFIACADNKIYNYSGWGIKQEGFKPLATIAEVNLPIKYCKVGLSDYLVTADRKGHLYAFSRRGDGRIDFKNKLIEDADNFEIEAGNLLANTQIVYYDNKSKLLEKISLSDKKEIYKTSESENNPAYCFNDFDKNSIVDVILAYADKLEVYDLNGTKNFSREFEDKVSPAAVSFFNMSSSSYISVFDNANSNTIINDIEQKTTKELKSTRETLICDLFNDGKTYLLVILNGELKCLKL